jgi:AraC-like DNA-binding protein
MIGSEPGRQGVADGERLLQRLLELGETAAARGLERAAPGSPGAPGAASFFRFTRSPVVRAEARALECPWLLLVLAGSAAVRARAKVVRAAAGELVFLPARIPLAIELQPEAAGEARALEIELLAEALARWLPTELALEPLTVERAAGAEEPWWIRPGRAALAALVGFCEGVLEPTTHPRVLEHQLEGVLLALAVEARPDPAAIDRARARLDLALAVRQLVRANPDGAWSLPAVAGRLGVSEATLRRRLAQQGTGLRRLVLEERMLVARTLLGDGRLNVNEVASRCGYVSAAKFSRVFKQAVGVVPSHYRAGHERGSALLS